MSTTPYLRYWQLLFTIMFPVPSRSEVNMALMGTPSQSSDVFPDRWTARQAIDNCTNQTFLYNCCSHTKASSYKEVWWRVDLGQKTAIQSITIFYRNGAENRFGGYSLYVSNSTIGNEQRTLCFKDNTIKEAEVDLNPTHTCLSLGRYVIVYNKRETPKSRDWYDDYAVLELCEVQVFGCPIGWYGNGNCNNTCSDSCFGGYCNPVSGSCINCFPGMYGELCEQLCSPNCSSTCEIESGQCIGCIIGQYGDNCERACSENCKDRKCAKSNGHCMDCNNGTYGDVCEIDCPNNCKDSVCQKDNGYCLGCNNGTYGDVCEIDCPNNCKDSVCQKDNGHCLECIPGKRGSFCDANCPSNCSTCSQTTDQCLECFPGLFDPNCTQTCSSSCYDGCNKITGECEAGCIDGFYGDNCTKTCPENCKQNRCFHEDGHCIGCNAGLYGSKCDQNCPSNCQDNICSQDSGYCQGCDPGYHGDECHQTCPVNCTDRTCHQSSGTCIGCVEGYHGDNCNKTCPDHCIQTICRQENGRCIDMIHPQADDVNVLAIAVGAGCGMVICVLVVAVILLARRKYRPISCCQTSKSIPESEIQQRSIGTSGPTSTIQSMYQYEMYLDPITDTSVPDSNLQQTSMDHAYDDIALNEAIQNTFPQQKSIIHGSYEAILETKQREYEPLYLEPGQRIDSDKITTHL
ncbi:scavenger receptor class F member 1-like isoform X9 [Argopecten irradians]|uniref:scavenger receptor class F member 1-like isoform X9 n=1 Tax=Argopecten irradians TaxID=31199 RepID=UPI00371D6087